MHCSGPLEYNLIRKFILKGRYIFTLFLSAAKYAVFEHGNYLGSITDCLMDSLGGFSV